MKKNLYIFKDMFSPDYSHLDLFEVSERIIQERVIEDIIEFERELLIRDLKKNKIEFLTTLLEDKRQSIEQKYFIDKEDECSLYEIKDKIQYTLNFDSRKFQITEDTLNWFFFTFTHKYYILISYSHYDVWINNKSEFENIDAENFDHDEIEILFKKIDLDFKLIIDTIIYKYFLVKYEFYYDFEDIQKIEGTELKPVLTRYILVLSELGFLDNLKENNNYLLLHDCATDLMKMLPPDTNKKTLTRTLKAIANKEIKNNPYETNGNKDLLIQLQKLKDLLKKNS